jgi:ribosome maturation factor RimP
MKGESIDYEELGRFVADAIDQMENHRRFAGLDVACVFDVPLCDGTVYRGTLIRVEPEEEP